MTVLMIENKNLKENEIVQNQPQDLSQKLRNCCCRPYNCRKWGIIGHHNTG
jgi:hypothetical protein